MTAKGGRQTLADHQLRLPAPQERPSNVRSGSKADLCRSQIREKAEVSRAKSLPMADRAYNRPTAFRANARSAASFGPIGPCW
jgi:hypothetical protein